MQVIRLSIPENVPAVDRQRVLARVRRDIADLEDVMADARASGVVPLAGWRWAIRRMRSLRALEAAWVAVQVEGVA